MPERVILDEVQHVPELFEAIKISVDRRRAPGRFLLTGSTDISLVPRLSESLAGRLEFVPLHPLTQYELAGRSDPCRPDADFLDALFGDGFPVFRSEYLGAQLAEKIVAGGYPAALERPTARRLANWYRSYVDSLVRRDVRDMTRIRSLDVLPRLLRGAAAQTARLYNLSSLASPFELSRPSIESYVALLERLFLLERLPSWRSNRLTRPVKSPKLHLADTGLAAALLGADAKSLAADRILLGHLLETFVFQELRRQASWRDMPTEFCHFRDKDGVETDIVIEQASGTVAGVGVKAAATVSRADFRGLRKLEKAAGDRFARAWCSMTAKPASPSAIVFTRCRYPGCGKRRDPLRGGRNANSDAAARTPNLPGGKRRSRADADRVRKGSSRPPRTFSASAAAPFRFPVAAVRLRRAWLPRPCRRMAVSRRRPPWAGPWCASTRCWSAGSCG